MLTNFLPVQQQCNNSNEAQQNPAISKRMIGANSTSTYTSAGKPNSLVARTLQNVRSVDILYDSSKFSEKLKHS